MTQDCWKSFKRFLVLFFSHANLQMKGTFKFKLRRFLELDKINKFKVIFDIHHRITAKFILRCYQLRFGLVLCCLMTPGLSKDIRCHV